jgi:hypothetical protein
MSDSIPSLLSLLIGAGSLWLALGFARHHSAWFAALFALLGAWPAGRGTSGRRRGVLRRTGEVAVGRAVCRAKWHFALFSVPSGGACLL